MKRVLVFGVMVVAFLVACSQGPGTDSDNNSNTFIVEKSFDVVWENIADYIQTQQIQMQVRKTDSGFMETGFMQIAPAEMTQYVLPPEGRPDSQLSEGRIKATFYLWKVAENETLITINTQVEIWEKPNKYADGGNWLYAYSTGKFDKQCESFRESGAAMIKPEFMTILAISEM